MSKRSRIPKTLEEKLRDLDAHLFLLRGHLQKLRESPSHLKVISAELRTLVCFSSGTEGLLLRLIEELGVDDKIFLHVAGKLKKDHPLARGLQFVLIPIQRGGKGDPRLPPHYYSLKNIIRDTEALVAEGKPITHDYLIKAVAQQMGTSHEDEGLESVLVNLKSIFINGVEPFIPVLALDAELTLEIGERVIETAEKQSIFKRQPHEPNHGNVSLAVRLRIKQILAGRIPLFRFHSYVSDVDLSATAGPTGIAFTLFKHGAEVAELVAKYPANWTPGNDAVFVLLYRSQTRQARTITNGHANEIMDGCDIGWVHAFDFVLEDNHINHIDFIEKHFLRAYETLLSTQDSKSLLELPPNSYGLLKYGKGGGGGGGFPE